MGMAATGPRTPPPLGGGHNRLEQSLMPITHCAPTPAQHASPRVFKPCPPPGPPQGLLIFAFLPGETPPPQGNASCFSVAHLLLGPLL